MVTSVMALHLKWKRASEALLLMEAKEGMTRVGIRVEAIESSGDEAIWRERRAGEIILSTSAEAIFATEKLSRVSGFTTWAFLKQTLKEVKC